MQRAEQSTHSAKIVMDAKRLQSVKPERPQPPAADSPDDETSSGFIQMDAIPEGICIYFRHHLTF
jgi:hypothetical protein